MISGCDIIAMQKSYVRGVDYKLPNSPPPLIAAFDDNRVMGAGELTGKFVDELTAIGKMTWAEANEMFEDLMKENN